MLTLLKNGEIRAMQRECYGTIYIKRVREELVAA